MKHNPPFPRLHEHRHLLGILGLSLIAVTFPSGALGAGQSEHSLSSDSVRTPWTVFGGISGGVTAVSGNDFSKGPQGSQYALGLGLSHSTRKWVTDGNVSWLSSRIAGAIPGTESISIRTRTGMGDLSARYRIGERWQVGPVVNTLFGTDTQFGPSVESSIGSWFAGVKGVYEFPSERLPIRITQQLSTDVTISGRQVTLAFVGLQIGLPIRRNGTTLASTGKDQIRTSAAAPAGPETRITLVLDPQKVFFDTNSADLKPRVKAILRDVGRYLDDESHVWESLEISGHADQRGSYGYNQILSEKRAKSVSSVLKASGVEPNRLQAQGYSFSRPLDPRRDLKAYAKNRRVELTFKGLQDPAPLILKLKPLMKESVE